MTTEELLRPRYKVIADYPGRPITMPVGHILTLDKFGAGKWWHEFTDEEPVHIDEGSERFPSILRKLEWWEYRKLEDMPKYIKDVYGKVCEVVYENIAGVLMCFDKNDIEDGYPYKWTRIFPATETEYLDYKNKQE